MCVHNLPTILSSHTVKGLLRNNLLEPLYDWFWIPNSKTTEFQIPPLLHGRHLRFFPKERNSTILFTLEERFCFSICIQSGTFNSTCMCVVIYILYQLIHTYFMSQSSYTVPSITRSIFRYPHLSFVIYLLVHDIGESTTFPNDGSLNKWERTLEGTFWIFDILLPPNRNHSHRRQYDRFLDLCWLPPSCTPSIEQGSLHLSTEASKYPDHFDS